MELFLSLLLKILPLYIIILLGYAAGRYYDVQKESLANLAIYIISPAVFFLGTLRAGLTFDVVFFPVIFLVIGCILALTNLWIGKFLWQDKTRDIAAITVGTGNTGYFGIPVCLALLGPESLPIAVLFAFGASMYENTLAYYLSAKAHYTAREAFKKLMKVPTLYAFLAAVIINILQITVPDVIMSTAEIMKGAYSPVGMMIIGISLSSIAIHHVDFKFLSLTFCNKFLVWPLIALAIIWIDIQYFQYFNALTHKVLIVESIVPLAANTVALAIRYKVQPEKAALAVIASTIFALIYVPLVVSYL